jgi:ribosome-binding ATPase YchF (GTP1/OBG family)
LNLATYFTAGVQEVRAWTIHKEISLHRQPALFIPILKRVSSGPKVIKYNDFVQYGSEAACRDNGKLSVQGKVTWWMTAISCISVSTFNLPTSNKKAIP